MFTRRYARRSLLNLPTAFGDDATVEPAAAISDEPSFGAASHAPTCFVQHSHASVRTSALCQVRVKPERREARATRRLTMNQARTNTLPSLAPRAQGLTTFTLSTSTWAPPA